MTETAWVGAAYNMLLFYIASNVSLFIHASTYLFIKSTRAKWNHAQTSAAREYPQGKTAPNV